MVWYKRLERELIGVASLARVRRGAVGMLVRVGAAGPVSHPRMSGMPMPAAPVPTTHKACALASTHGEAAATGRAEGAAVELAGMRPLFSRHQGERAILKSIQIKSKYHFLITLSITRYVSVF